MGGTAGSPHEPPSLDIPIPEAYVAAAAMSAAAPKGTNLDAAA